VVFLWLGLSAYPISAWALRIIRPNGRTVSPSASYLITRLFFSSGSQGFRLPVRPLLRRGSLDSGIAPGGRRRPAIPGRTAASATSMSRCPLRNACARPAKVAICVVWSIARLEARSKATQNLTLAPTRSVGTITRNLDAPPCSSPTCRRWRPQDRYRRQMERRPAGLMEGKWESRRKCWLLLRTVSGQRRGGKKGHPFSRTALHSTA
jgi:hypothetical protein